MIIVFSNIFYKVLFSLHFVFIRRYICHKWRTDIKIVLFNPLIWKCVRATFYVFSWMWLKLIENIESKIRDDRFITNSFSCLLIMKLLNLKIQDDGRILLFIKKWTFIKRFMLKSIIDRQNLKMQNGGRLLVFIKRFIS